MSLSSRRNKRIVHFSSVHPMDDVRVFHKQCRSLANAGYDVTLISRGATSDVTDGVKRISVPRRSSGGRIVRMLVDTLKVSKLAWNQRAELYQFHDPELIPVGLLFRLLGRKVIYDAHEDYRDDILSKKYIPYRFRRFVSRCVGLLEDFAKGRFTAVIAATPRIAETLATKHTQAILNYPMVEEISNEAANRVRDSGTAIYAGGMTVIRGIEQMIDAMEPANAQQPIRLTMCGTIPAEFKSQLELREGWQYVDALGMQPRDRMIEQFSTATCGLIVFHPEPNHVEAMPNKLFEYMAAGLPVVASNFPFWKQFVEDIGSGVMVDPMDPQAIADGILEIVNDPERARAMGEAGAKAVRERFNWDSEAEKLVALVDRLTGGTEDAVGSSH